MAKFVRAYVGANGVVIRYRAAMRGWSGYLLQFVVDGDVVDEDLFETKAACVAAAQAWAADEQELDKEADNA